MQDELEEQRRKTRCVSEMKKWFQSDLGGRN